MNFKHLKITSCPVCHTDVVVRESLSTSSYTRPTTIRVHTNGQRWETREFICGCIVEWTPNYSRACYQKPCSKHPKLAALMEQAEALAQEEARVRLARQENDAKIQELAGDMTNSLAVYAVLVGNVGCVYDGSEEDTAETTYDAYVDLSKEGYGRVAGEPVVLMLDGEPVREWTSQEDLAPV